MLLVGFFLPVISFFGLLSFSYFDLLTKVSARFITGLVIFALGGLSLLLALKNNFKPLIGTGILALAILAFDFITYKKAMAGSMSPTGQTGTDTTGSVSADFGRFGEELAGIVMQPAWGVFIMAAGAILLIVAGAMKNKTSMNGQDWRQNPPPPMNYT
jgi:4-amino-4-deoxy-L-arabinose transferase-like glycosyltransferase